MTKVALPGVTGYYYGALAFGYPYHAPGGLTSHVVDATGEKVAMIGRYVNNARATRDITRVLWRAGSITSAGGSILRISLQDVDLANGPPFRPDGTQDQTVDQALSTLTAGGFNRSNALSANRTLAHGDLVAVVWEFDPGGRLGADAFGVVAADMSGGIFGGVSHLTAAWAALLTLPNVILEDTLGGYGTVAPGVLILTTGTTSFKQDTAGADEYGVRFKIPHKSWCIGAWVALNFAANTSDCDIVLYDSAGTALKTVTVDANAVVRTAGTNWYEFYFASEQELTANTEYFLAVKPTQITSNVTLSWSDVSANGHLAVFPGGIEMYEAKRLDLGTFATTTTRLPHMGPILSHVDDGAGGSGGSAGILVHPGMGGGMRG